MPRFLDDMNLDLCRSRELPVQIWTPPSKQLGSVRWELVPESTVWPQVGDDCCLPGFRSLWLCAFSSILLQALPVPLYKADQELTLTGDFRVSTSGGEELFGGDSLVSEVRQRFQIKGSSSFCLMPSNLRRRLETRDWAVQSRQIHGLICGTSGSRRAHIRQTPCNLPVGSTSKVCKQKSQMGRDMKRSRNFKIVLVSYDLVWITHNHRNSYSLCIGGMESWMANQNGGRWDGQSVVLEWRTGWPISCVGGMVRSTGWPIKCVGVEDWMANQLTY